MRPRTKDRHLPACVYQKHGAYWYVKGGKWRKIGTDLHAALVEYARIVATPKSGMGALIGEALPHLIRGKSASTSRHYTNCAEELKEVFSTFYPEQVRHGDVVEMMDLYKERPAHANHMLTVLKLTFQWALDRGRLETNPCISVKRAAAPSRDRLISQQEYAAIYKMAAPWLQCIMDMCYLTGQRIGDVLSIRREQLLDAGIYFQQQKTGKRLVVAWTPELRAVLARAAAEQGPVADMSLVLSGRGGKPRLHSNVWKAFKLAAEKAGVRDVTLHDLRAMSGTEAEQQGIDPTALLGHTDARTTRIYLRDKTAKVVKGPSRKAG